MAFFKGFRKSKIEPKDSTSAHTKAVGLPTDSIGSPRTGNPMGTGSPLPMAATRSASGRSVLKGFHVTEKSARAAARNQYVFIVERDAYKNEVKRTVEARFGVSVEDVHIVNLPAKIRRRGAEVGWKAGRKKAIVTVKEGQKIEAQ